MVHCLLALGLLAPAVLAKPSAAASPAKPAPPLWAAYVKPEAVDAMKTFFEGDAAHKLKDDKSILNLAQGKPVELSWDAMAIAYHSAAAAAPAAEQKSAAHKLVEAGAEAARSKAA